MNQMWVKDDEWIDSLLWQEEEAREEIPSIRIPLDKEGADIMYSVIGPRTQIPDSTDLSGRGHHEPKPGWTGPCLPARVGTTAIWPCFPATWKSWAGSNGRTLKPLKSSRSTASSWVNAGHAYRSVYDVGNRWLGWREHPVPVMHAIEFYWELLDKGLLKVARKFEEPVTLHDPCNIVRGRGLHEKARDIIKALCKEFVEMVPNREHNYCCAAGGGVINCGPPYKNVRMEGNKVKADQMKATGTKIVIAPCHNCHSGLEDISHHYELGMTLKFFSEIIYDCMEKPNAV